MARWITPAGPFVNPHRCNGFDDFHRADHVAGSESWTRTEGQGRVVQEWRLRPAAPDNHWLDCLVGCAVAASMLGATLPGLELIRQGRRKRYTQADLQAKR